MQKLEIVGQELVKILSTVIVQPFIVQVCHRYKRKLEPSFWKNAFNLKDLGEKLSSSYKRFNKRDRKIERERLREKD